MATYLEIGLLEVAWKVIKGVLDGRLKRVKLHDALHSIRKKRECDTRTTEAKFFQQLAFIEQCPLYGIFLDLRIAYNVMDRYRYVEILEDCRVGVKDRCLINYF